MAILTLSRLFHSANAAALVAAFAHVISIMIIAGGVGLEGIYIFVLTYLIAIAVAVPIGAVLLLISGYFKLGRLASLILFAIVIQGVAAIVVMFLFETKLSQVPLQFGFVTLPATLAAWYFSVYHFLNKGSGT